MNDELSSTVGTDVDLETLRNGGPTRTPGMQTTTGGTAGPASVAATLREHHGGPAGDDAGSAVPDQSLDQGDGGR